MRRALLASVAVGVLVAVAIAAAAQSPSTFGIPIRTPSSTGSTLTIVCAPLDRGLDVGRFYGNLALAGALLFEELEDGGEVSAAFLAREKEACAAAYALAKDRAGKPGAMTASVTRGAAPAAKGAAVEVRIRGTCPFRLRRGRCAPERVTTIRISGIGASPNACNVASGNAFPFRNAAGEFGPAWKGQRLLGRRTSLAPGQVVPAMLEIACATSTPRSRTLARELGAPAPAPPPTDPPKEVRRSWDVPADGTVRRTVTTSGTLRLRFENLSREFDSSRCATLLIQLHVDEKALGAEIGVIPGGTTAWGSPGRVSPGRHTFSVTSRVYRGACEQIPHPGGRLDVITSAQ